MNQKGGDLMAEKKQRGQKRRLKALLEGIERIMPFGSTDARYECFSVPSSPFISSPKTSGKVKTVFCRAWLKKAEEIAEKTPEELSFCRVVALINECDLWRSQIIVFYDQAYFEEFWKRDCAEQQWAPMKKESRSFIKERFIATNLKETGYRETVLDDGILKRSILWFYSKEC